MKRNLDVLTFGVIMMVSMLNYKSLCWLVRG